MPDRTTDIEIQRFDKWRGGILAVYPTGSELEPRIDQSQFVRRPFTLAMAQGCAHLDFRVFDLGVLEQYRNDPRYYYRAGDVDGDISVHDEHYLGKDMKDSDKVLLRFGFAYDRELNRGVAVFLTDLRRLSLEHQQIWQARLLDGEFHLHPIFWETKVQGIWSRDTVITNAFLWELHRINECCDWMGRPHLFLHDYWQVERPKNFCFLIRPTAKEFADFCRTLDKLMSDNINRKFFEGEVSATRENLRKDGKIEVVAKGTITMLNEWLLANWNPKDRVATEAIFSSFKTVRRLRNPDAHAFLDDAFRQKFLHEQRELLVKAYQAVRMLRLIFETHPQALPHANDCKLKVRNVLIY
jgi:hypothetical protein